MNVNFDSDINQHISVASYECVHPKINVLLECINLI